MTVENRDAHPAVFRLSRKLLEEVRERLLHAGGILDFDAGHLQAENGEAHRHAMVVVGFDFRAVQRRREDRERVALLDDFRAALGQFRPQRDHALALLHTQAAEVGELERLDGKGSDGKRFLFEMQRTDAYRKQNFADTHPEIAKAMGYE